MALGDPYATLAEIKDYLSITATSFDDELADALASASEEIERSTNRQFNKTTTATARVFVPDQYGCVRADDFHTSTGFVLKTDESGDGTFETTWTSADYELFPLNGVVNGQTGWPFNKIYATDNRWFPINVTGRRGTVEVTAQWGWASVPAPVKQACLILAAETFQLKDAPLGVAGMGEFGVVRVRDNKMADKKLRKYTRSVVLVG